MPGLRAALRRMESGDLEGAAADFAALAGPSREGGIARFRRAECLSRLGRHAEAVETARTALADAPGTPAAALWLAQCLAEAGREGEAAAVPFPDGHDVYVGPVREGFRALAELVGAAPCADRGAVVEAIRASRHAPVLSLALRTAERDRLLCGPRAPDLHSVYAAHDCRMDREGTSDAETPHVRPPLPRDPAAPTAGEARSGMRWLRLHWACGDWSDLVASLRRRSPEPEGLDECELEMLLALGRVDAAERLAQRLLDAAGADASGELCIDVTRVRQLRGAAARPQDVAGFRDARRRLGAAIAWLDLGCALIEGRSVDARVHADRLSDPAHGEYVEAALLSWAGRGRPAAASAGEP